MTSINTSQLVKDLANRKLKITRQFDADLETVWAFWTKSELLEQWWAPKPWHAETKTMNFQVGGHWLYAMVGPANERHWAQVDFVAIDQLKSFQVEEFFCDENGGKGQDPMETQWKNDFQSTSNGTQVTVVITANEKANLEKMLEMGFEEGFNMALGNLDECLKARTTK